MHRLGEGVEPLRAVERDHAIARALLDQDGCLVHGHLLAGTVTRSTFAPNSGSGGSALRSAERVGGMERSAIRGRQQSLGPRIALRLRSSLRCRHRSKVLSTSSIALCCSAPSFSTSRASCSAASTLARLRFLTRAGQMQRVRAPVGGRVSRWVRPRFSSLSSRRTSRARSMPSVSARSDCEIPGLAPITTSTEYCAGRMSIARERADEVLEHPDLRRGG